MSSAATPAPVPAAKPQTFLGRLVGNLTTGAAALFSSIVDVVEHEAWPFIETLFKTIALDNIKALAPLALAALSEVEGELPVLFSQGAEGFLKVFNATVAGTLQKAEAASLNVTETDVITAAHAAVLNAKAALPAAS